MRTGDSLYFAPGIRFSEVDLTGIVLSKQFEKRIRGFYLNPVKDLLRNDYGFAAGLILVSSIDALARLQLNSKEVGIRFQTWIQSEIPSFNDPQIAKMFYEHFRNGLVHEARIKNGGEFSLESDSTVIQTPFSLVVNPFFLYREVSDALANFISLIENNEGVRGSFIQTLKNEFTMELAGAGT